MYKLLTDTTKSVQKFIKTVTNTQQWLWATLYTTIRRAYSVRRYVYEPATNSWAGNSTRSNIAPVYESLWCTEWHKLNDTTLVVLNRLLWRYVRSYAKNCRGHVTGHAHFQGKLFVRLLDIPHTESRVPNLKSLAQVVLQLLTPQWLTWPWTTSKQRSRSFMLVPIDFSYSTSYRLSIVTFALGRTA